MDQLLTGLIKNHTGVLASITDKFKDMKINIKSIVCAQTDDENMSYLTIVAEATDINIEKLRKNLASLVDIKKFEKLGQGDHYERELVLVKVSLKSGEMAHIMQIAEVFRAHAIGVDKCSITLELVGDDEQVKGFMKMLKPFGIKAIARTGRTALKTDE